MKKFTALLMNSLRLEFRTRETALLLLSLIAMLAVIVSLGLNAAFIDPVTKEKLYPCLLWVLFLLSATMCVGRSFEYEAEFGAMDGLILTGISMPLFYAAKVVSNFLILFIGQCFAAILLAIFMNVPLPDLSTMIPVFALSIVGYAALATLLSGITVTAKLKQVLLPIVLLPLLFPIFLCAIELTYMVRAAAAPDWSSPWFAALLGLDILYVVLGMNLFEYVVRD